jgi:hypothetical protein
MAALGRRALAGQQESSNGRIAETFSVNSCLVTVHPVEPINDQIETRGLVDIYCVGK